MLTDSRAGNAQYHSRLLQSIIYRVKWSIHKLPHSKAGSVQYDTYIIILKDFSAQYIEPSDQYIYLLIQGLVMSNIILEDLSAQYIESSDQ